jgi:hypothetical protein
MMADLNAARDMPKLSRLQRRKVLKDITGERINPFYFFGMVTPGFIILVCLTLVMILRATATEQVFNVTRQVQETTSTVKPNFDNILIMSLDSQLDKLEKVPVDTDRIESLKKERMLIEDRLRARSDTNVLPSSSSTATTTATTPTTNSTTTIIKTTTTTTKPVAEPYRERNDDYSNQRRDECRDRLDELKATGVRVGSEDYKKCDNL